MANVSPATVTITSTVGPGLSATATKFTDVTNIAVDFQENTVRIQRQNSNGLQYYDYSAMATFTWTISGGLSTLVISS